MKNVNFDYSMKNIPIPSNREYTKRLIEKTEDFTKRLRCRAYFFLNPTNKTKQTETYGFRSRKIPPTVAQLKPFEDSLLKLIENIKFRKVESDFQRKLQQDVQKINKESNVIVPADKTSNYYSVTQPKYDKLIKDSITATYKRSDERTINTINRNANKIASELDIADRIDKLPEKPAYVTLKDHKENFRTHPTCRLINPTKSEIGKISKQLLDNINKRVLEATNFNQWKNTTAVIDWFNTIKTKPHATFLTFDVVNFYPSITKELLLQALQFAENYTTISKEEKEIIIEAKSTVLFHNSSAWQKANSQDLFDVTMGSHDGAESCELVGTFILSKISKLLPQENVGLYRDDGLAVVTKPPAAAEKLKKKLCEEFKKLGLQITATANTTTTDFLDVTFNLSNGEYKPYAKPGSKHIYVHTASNHPPLIIKRIPKSIESRLSNISSTQEIFDNNKPAYEAALKEAGHRTTLTYTPASRNDQTATHNRNRRKRNITWYNPPYSKSVQTNIGQKFLTLIEQHFPKNHELHKICNNNTLKLSYSCTENMSNILKTHNQKITKPLDNQQQHEKCNCRDKNNCPLPGRCTAQNVIYQATVSTDNDTKHYIGLTATTFKTRYTSHKATFRDRGKRNNTELSKHIWDLKESDTTYNIKWKILQYAQPYTPRTKRCNLCLSEKFHILKAEKINLLNSRSEIISTCRHKRKFLLSSAP
jgi:hypothetical protein